MPELPEVETIRKQLNRALEGKKIKSIDVKLPKLIKHPLKDFRKSICGASIKKATRRGKIIIIELSNGLFLAIHLKLSGQLICLSAGAEAKAGRHTHIIYNFSDGSRLFHNDLRQFGYVKLFSKKDLNEFLTKENLGPEPLDKKFTFRLFKEQLLNLYLIILSIPKLF